MTYDPKYKMRHKPPQVGRLLRWKDTPPRMIGDPEWYRQIGKDPWQSRCEAIYASMMSQKRGELPPVSQWARRWLWMWEV